MPMAAAQGHLGYARVGYTSLPSGKGWITLGSNILTTNSSYPKSIAIDSADNILVAGSDHFPQPPTGSFAYSSSLFKLNSNGIYQYNSYIDNGNEPAQYGSYPLNCEFVNCAVDNSNNLYAVGYGINPAGFSVSPAIRSYSNFLVKYDSNGIIQWQKMFRLPLSATPNRNEEAIDVGIDGSGNIYVGTHLFGGTSLMSYVTKFNASGVIQWSRRIAHTQPSSSDTEINNVVVDSAGNQYILVHEYVFDTGLEFFHIIKLNNSGTVIWKIKFDPPSPPFNQGSLTINDTGTNICFVYGLGYVIINSSGIITRQNSIDPNGGIYIIKGQLSSDGSVYLLGQNSPTPISTTNIIKFDSNDSLVYVNKLETQGGTVRPRGLIYKNNSIYISCLVEYYPGSSYGTFKLPSDGYIPSKGSYKVTVGTLIRTFTYTRINITTVGSSFSVSPSTYPVTTDTFTNSTTTLPDSSRTLNWGNLLL